MAYTGWALVELMGHRSRVGKVSEVTMYGATLPQIEIPVFDGADKSADFVTELYGGASLYGVTPVAEDVGIEMAKRRGDPRPVRPTTFQLNGPPSIAEGQIVVPPEDGPEDDDEEPRF